MAAGSFWKKMGNRFSPQFYSAHETHRMLELEGKRLASFPTRAFAMLIDVCAILFVFTLLAILIAALTGRDGSLHVEIKFPEAGAHVTVSENHEAKEWLQYIIEIGVLLCYWGLLTYATNGKTVGKWLAGARVLSTTRNRISLWQSFERALGYSISALELGFGFFQYFIVPNRRTTHDRIAETIVVRDRPGLPRLYQKLKSFFAGNKRNEPMEEAKV